MKKIMIRAALEQASFEDCIRKNGDCVENKIMFVKHPVSKEMYGYTKIYEGDGNDSYYKKEIKTEQIENIKSKIDSNLVVEEKNLKNDIDKIFSNVDKKVRAIFREYCHQIPPNSV